MVGHVQGGDDPPAGGMARSLAISSRRFMARMPLIRRSRVWQQDPQNPAVALSLKFRDHGQQNDARHRLKRMFQKHRVPPWERAAIAQVYLDGKLEGLLL